MIMSIAGEVRVSNLWLVIDMASIGRQYQCVELQTYSHPASEVAIT
jgi:hypothetical protein